MINVIDGLCFDDVLLIPKFSSIKSRSEIDTSVRLPKGFIFEHPLIPANMKSVTGKNMAKCIADSGGLAILHRFMPIEEQLNIVNDFFLMTLEGTPEYLRHVGFSVGVKKEGREEIDALVTIGAQILCIDVAHGHSQMSIETCKYIAEKHPQVLLIAGNVATRDGARDLFLAGADVVKAGIGPGSICSTRIETGNGIPQLTALYEVLLGKKMAEGALRNQQDPALGVREFAIIADGGIKSAGDCVKALCYANMIMVGNLFAGADETPGKIIWEKGNPYKEYAGSSTHKKTHVEGVKALVPAKGSTKGILEKLLDGITSGCSYQGCINLEELKNDPKFTKITNAGLRESHPHDVQIINDDVRLF